MTVLKLISIPSLLLLILFTGCDRQPAAGGGAPPAPKVTVARPIVRDVTQWDEYSGRLVAVETVRVKSQVSGFVESVNFAEGAIVHKNDVLLTIDSRIFRAQLESAKAAELQAHAKLQQAQAALQLAQNDFKRADQAAKNGGITAEELDTRRANVAQNEATVAENNAAIAVAEAAVKSAILNVEWCKVIAPITGRISDKLITPGNMLTGGPGDTTTTITTIASVDPIYCYVDADESSVLKYQKLARERKRDSAADMQLVCYMGLDNEVGFPHTGYIDFLDNHINPTTATRRARGVFANPDGTLLPGFFARFRVVGLELKGALLVMDDAVGTDQDRRYIFVMHPDKTIERRTVSVGPLIGELRVITSDLKPDETVIVNGLGALMSVRPGGTVDPTVVPMPEHRLAEVAAAAAAQSTSQPASQSATRSAPATTEAAR